MLKKVFNVIKKIFIMTDNDGIYAAAGHSTLFIIISFFPAVMLLLAMAKFLPYSESQVLSIVEDIPLGVIKEPIFSAINDIYNRSGSLVISITIITLIWTASTSVYSLMLGLNRIYNAEETRNYFIVRGAAIIFTVILLLSLAASLIIIVFGKTLANLLKIKLFHTSFFANLGTLIILILIFDFMYKVIPNRKSSVLLELPGAVFTALGWVIFSYFYSLYIENFSNVSFVYGSLAAVVLLMIWLYFCMYMFFIGAEINKYLRTTKYYTYVISKTKRKVK